MRSLSDEETRVVFEKLSKFLGPNLQQLIDRQDETHVFRLHKDRVYYMSEKLVKSAQNIPRKMLLSAGICFGKFTHSGKFRLLVTCLDYLAKLAKYKVWIKPGGEQSFVYGNHIVKAHLKRVSEDMPGNAGVVVFNEADIPIGFGVSAKSVGECRAAGTETIVVYHQADVGEYLREEADLL